MVYQCNGWIYDNAYLITFKVGHLRAHTHLLNKSCHFWKHRRKASFGIFYSSSVAFHLMSSMVAKSVLLRPVFRVGNSQKSLGARSGSYGGWVMIGMLYWARNCCTTSDVCSMSSFGWFPGVWFIIADVSEHSICSIFLGRRFEVML
jgi:hypothetical protein